MNTYNVTFVFDYATLTTTVMAMHEDACPDLAAWQVRGDLGIDWEVLDRAEAITVELVDENVGIDDAVVTA